MNIKIGRKLALINDLLNDFGVEKIDNVFEITAVTDAAVNVKNIYNHRSYTLSLQSFDVSLKTFLTDEILARKNKKKANQIKEKKPVVNETIEVVTTTHETNETTVINETPEPTVTNTTPELTFMQVAPTPLGKLVFRNLTLTPIVQTNSDPYADDPYGYGDLYG